MQGIDSFVNLLKMSKTNKALVKAALLAATGTVGVMLTVSSYLISTGDKAVASQVSEVDKRLTGYISSHKEVSDTKWDIIKDEFKDLKGAMLILNQNQLDSVKNRPLHKIKFKERKEE